MPSQQNKEMQRRLPLLNISSINLVLPYQNFIMSESDKLKYYTPVSGLNVALLIITYFSEIFCRCGSIENTEHYLLQCRLYQQPGVEMPNSVSQLCHVTLDVLLSGDCSFSIDINSKIFSIVQKFIKDSKRF